MIKNTCWKMSICLLLGILFVMLLYSDVSENTNTLQEEEKSEIEPKVPRDVRSESLIEAIKDLTTAINGLKDSIDNNSGSIKDIEEKIKSIEEKTKRTAEEIRNILTEVRAIKNELNSVTFGSRSFKVRQDKQ